MEKKKIKKFKRQQVGLKEQGQGLHIDNEISSHFLSLNLNFLSYFCESLYNYNIPC